MAIADAEARAVGRHGAVTLDEAAAAARKLREYTRGELAAELGIKPIAVGKFLSSLTERGIHEADEDERGVFYRCLLEPLKSDVFLAPEPAPDPLEEDEEREQPFDDLEGATEEEVRHLGRVTAEEVRDWAIMLERFTIYQLAREMEVPYGTARRFVTRLVDQGILIDSGWKGAHDSVIYELRGEVPESRLRFERRPPVEHEVLAKWKPQQQAQRGIEVAARGCPRVSNDKDVQRLAQLAYVAGWTVEQRSKHYRIVSPAGTVIGVPSTPGKGLSRMRDELRRAGLPTLSIGEANEQLDRPSEHGKTIDATSRTHQRRKATMNVAGTRRPGRKNQGRHNKK